MSFLAMLEMYLHKSILKSYDQVNLYLAPSKFMADKVIEWGIEPPKVKQIYNFINLDKYQPVDDLGDYVLYFGRLSQEKGLLDLVATAKDLPELKFKIAGKGPLAEKLKAYIIKQQIQNIELVGYKAGADLTELIQKSRLVILPSIWYENNPISIYEAWALGKSVIASDLGGNSELIEKSQAGELFQAGDKKSLKSLLKTSYYDKNKLIQQGKNGRKYLENYINSGKHWQQLEKIYQRLI